MYKYKRNGFTLVELMAVIIIISLIALLTFPNIINQIKKTKKSNNKMVEDIVLAQAKKYVSDNKDEFEEDRYCLSIDTLIDNDYIKENVIDIVDDLKDNKVIEIKYNNTFKYKIVNQNKCCTYDICDDNGNGYTEVEYLESTGTQYIDLETKGNQNNKIELHFFVTEQIQKRGIFGFFGQNINSYYIYSSGAGDVFQVGFQNRSNTKISIAANEEYTITNDANIIIINENNYNLPNATIFETTDNLLLFNLSGGDYIGLPIRLYYFKLYENDELIRDLIPVIDSQERPCMFDKVEKKCYYNNGTGEFLWG